MNYKKGFTIIELIVVIAIIAVLAGIVLTNVSGYIAKAKIARAKTDAKNIETALEAFYAQYGDYPYSAQTSNACPAPRCVAEFFSSAYGGTGDPYLMVPGSSCPDSKCHLSQFYSSDWENYNADYFTTNGVYDVQLFDNDGDSKIGCGTVDLFDSGMTNSYGTKFILCQDCPCGTGAYVNSGIFQ